MTTTRHIFFAIIAATCGVLADLEAAIAQTYPNRPVRFIVPAAAGGSADVAGRILAEHLARALGQQIYVEDKPGASGNTGIELAAKSPADGYTVLIAPDWVASNPHVYSVSIDPLKDLVPVVQISRQPIALAVHPSLGIHSIAELVALVKQQPGLSYALGGGRGNAQHIAAEWFSRLADIKLEAVPYRGGGQAINDLIAGHVKIGSLGSSPLIPHYQSGTLRLLAQSTAERSPSLPQVPTYQEAGIKGLVLDQWIGVFVPAGTPPAISARLNAGINKALSDSAIKASLMLQAQEPVGGTAEQFARLVHRDFEKYARLVKELNIKGD